MIFCNSSFFFCITRFYVINHILRMFDCISTKPSIKIKQNSLTGGKDLKVVNKINQFKQNK